MGALNCGFVVRSVKYIVNSDTCMCTLSELSFYVATPHVRLAFVRRLTNTLYYCVAVVNRFYIALFSALEQTHCARRCVGV